MRIWMVNLHVCWFVCIIMYHRFVWMYNHHFYQCIYRYMLFSIVKCTYKLYTHAYIHIYMHEMHVCDMYFRTFLYMLDDVYSYIIFQFHILCLQQLYPRRCLGHPSRPLLVTAVNFPLPFAGLSLRGALSLVYGLNYNPCPGSGYLYVCTSCNLTIRLVSKQKMIPARTEWTLLDCLHTCTLIHEIWFKLFIYGRLFVCHIYIYVIKGISVIWYIHHVGPICPIYGMLSYHPRMALRQAMALQPWGGRVLCRRRIHRENPESWFDKANGNHGGGRFLSQNMFGYSMVETHNMLPTNPWVIICSQLFTHAGICYIPWWMWTPGCKATVSYCLVVWVAHQKSHHNNA